MKMKLAVRLTSFLTPSLSLSDDYHLPPDALPPLPEIPHGGVSSGDPLGRPHRAPSLRSCSMDSSTDSERPVSYGSTTSSSASSSRDSHCSLGSRSTLASPAPPGPAPEAGAIQLELVPARQLDDEGPGPAQAAPLAPPPVTPTGPKLQYVDRVVQEILDTERTYVQDLRSIVQVREGGQG